MGTKDSRFVKRIVRDSGVRSTLAREFINLDRYGDAPLGSDQALLEADFFNEVSFRLSAPDPFFPDGFLEGCGNIVRVVPLIDGSVEVEFGSRSAMGHVAANIGFESHSGSGVALGECELKDSVSQIRLGQGKIILKHESGPLTISEFDAAKRAIVKNFDEDAEFVWLKEDEQKPRYKEDFTVAGSYLFRRLLALRGESPSNKIQFWRHRLELAVPSTSSWNAQHRSFQLLKSLDPEIDVETKAELDGDVMPIEDHASFGLLIPGGIRIWWTTYHPSPAAQELLQRAIRRERS